MRTGKRRATDPNEREAAFLLASRGEGGEPEVQVKRRQCAHDAHRAVENPKDGQEVTSAQEATAGRMVVATADRQEERTAGRG